MEYITEKNEKYVFVSKQVHLDELCDSFAQGELFANKFKFSERDFFISLLKSLKIDYEDFKKTYFYYDGNRKLHIAESEFEYVWISTYGLIAKSKSTSNRAVNACLNQYTVISLLFKKALKVSQDENVYNIDSYNFGLLSELSPAIFHNLIFYIEVFCKAYLSLAKVEAPKTHKLSLLYQETANIMASKEHDNSLFQVLILDPLYKFVDHL